MSQPVKKYKIVAYFKTTLHFIILLIWKSFNTSRVLQVESVQPNKNGIGQVVKNISRNCINLLDKENGVKQNFKKLLNGEKKKFKTWAQVKIDFQEYYDDLRKEFRATEAVDNSSKSIDAQTKGKISKEDLPK